MDKIILNDVTQIANNVESERFSGKKILLTGAVGFLGTYFTHYFINYNWIMHPNNFCIGIWDCAPNKI